MNIKTVEIKGVKVLAEKGNAKQYCNDTQAVQKAIILLANGIDAKVKVFPMSVVRYIQIYQ